MVEMVGVVWVFEVVRVVEVDRVAGVFEVAEVAGVVHHVGPVHRGIYLDNIKKAVYYLLSSISSLRC